MDFGADMDTKLPASDWHIVGAKQKQGPNQDAIQTPLPNSPTRNKPSMAATVTPNTMETMEEQQKERNATDTETHNESTYVHMNDGTLRITVKWKPTNYDELTENSKRWSYEATDLVC